MGNCRLEVNLKILHGNVDSARRQAVQEEIDTNRRRGCHGSDGNETSMRRADVSHPNVSFITQLLLLLLLHAHADGVGGTR
jgi:hypothetical protein